MQVSHDPSPLSLQGSGSKSTGGATCAGFQHLTLLLVNLLAVLVDAAISHLLFYTGFGLGAAHNGGFLGLIAINLLSCARWRSGWLKGETSGENVSRWVAFLAASALIFFLRGGILACLVELRGWSAQAGSLAAIATAGVFVYLSSAFILHSPHPVRFRAMMSHWALPFGVVAYVLALRLLYLGLPELLQEEAYYWNYAKHLDIGYLDHPPMVAWTIWVSTRLLGDSEFAVRIGAFVWWFVAAGFSFALTKSFFDRSAALFALLLLSIAPFFFMSGFVMTPDAPLTAFWSGALYFLSRALIDERRQAWWGAGVCIGLGMLSKYTIVLLWPATLMFLLVNRRLRSTLSRPEPYLAVLIAGLLFAPVILWNANHEWVSFAFQGPRRVQEPFQFSTHKLLLEMLLLADAYRHHHHHRNQPLQEQGRR